MFQISSPQEEEEAERASLLNAGDSAFVHFRTNSATARAWSSRDLELQQRPPSNKPGGRASRKFLTGLVSDMQHNSRRLRIDPSRISEMPQCYLLLSCTPNVLLRPCTTIFLLFSFILLSMSCFVAVTPIVRPDIYRGGARLHRFGKGGNYTREKTYLEWKDTDTLKMFSSASMSKKAFFFHIPYIYEGHFIICLRLNIRCFFRAAF